VDPEPLSQQPRIQLCANLRDYDIVAARRLNMSDTAQQEIRKMNWGDAAVDGLYSGILAGLGMAATLMVMGLFSGIPAMVTMGRFDPGTNGSWLSGSLAHLAVSGVYGVVFALLYLLAMRWRPSSFSGLRRYGWLWGLVYGLVLATLAQGMLLPVANSPLLETAAAHLIISHAIYGLVLGFEVSRRW
jgi:hypothetical protein